MTIIDPITPTPLTPLPYHPEPWSNITPFTYKSARTWAKFAEDLRFYINRVLIPHVDEGNASLVGQIIANIEKMIEDVNAALASQAEDVNEAIEQVESNTELAITALTTYVNNAVEQIINSAIEVQDPVLAGILADEESASRGILDALLASLRRAATRVITSNEWGIDSTDAPSVLAKSIQEFWNYCAANGYAAEMLPGTYLIDHFAEGTLVDSILTVPANADLRFRHGVILKRTFIEETVKQWSRMVTVRGGNSDNARLSGRLEMDGGGDGVTWYFEHNHCMFIYDAKNIDATSLKLVAYNAMGDNLSISGHGNLETGPTAGCSENVWIGTVDLGKARRKSLVIEATVNSGIYNANINNPVSGCFDYEPFNVIATGRVLSFNLRNLYCVGPIDLTAGANINAVRATLTGDEWVIVSREADQVNPYLSYGINLSLKKLTIDGRKFTGGGATNEFVSLAHTSLMNVLALEIIAPDAVSQKNILAVQATSSGSPVLNAGNIKLSGKTAINVLLSCFGKIGNITIDGVESPTTQLVFGSAVGLANSGANLVIDNIQLLNCYHADTLILPQALSGTVYRLVKIGNVSVHQTDARVSLHLFKVWTLTALLRFVVADVSFTPGSVTNFCGVLPGGVALMKTRNFPEESVYHGTSSAWTPEGVYAAAPGTRVLNALAGKVYMKTTDASLNTGWVAQA